MIPEISFNIYQPIKSSSGEIEEETFIKYTGTKWTWYVSTKENNADGIYVVTNNKEGMAGRHINFKLRDGTVESVHAPWKTGPSALREDTGINIEHNNLISYIISLDKVCGGCYKADIYKNVLEYRYKDLINFDVPKQRAEYWANRVKNKVYYSYISDGGGCGSWVNFNSNRVA